MITFTDSAIKKLEEAVDPGDYIRVGVVGGGCSGLSYTIEVDDSEWDKDCNDVKLDINKNIIVRMNPYSHNILKSVTVDYTESLHQSGFKFDNPDAAKSCGCGTSFRPEGFNKDEVPAGGCSTGGCGV
jgi:iron-sulfur cluster assembly protein